LAQSQSKGAHYFLRADALFAVTAVAFVVSRFIDTL